MGNDRHFSHIARIILEKTIRENFCGSDPYDGLNSRLLYPLIKNSRLCRLVLIQSVKRCPVNLRPLLRIPKHTNPKGLALILSGISYLPLIERQSDLQDVLGDRLLSMASKPNGSPAFINNRRLVHGMAAKVANDENISSLGWGYSFPWQGRAFMQPSWSPTVVCTSFVLDSLMDSNSPAKANVAIGTAQFVSRSLRRYEDDSGICFSYSPSDRTRVFNASLFGAKILACGAQYSDEKREEWITLAERAVEYVISRQNNDGSWFYGEAEHWQWIDNFHTGFVLECIADISSLLKTTRWDEHIIKGLEYYRNSLFERDGTALYYPNRKYPLDSHSFAQGAITFLKLTGYGTGGKETAERIIAKCIELLWNRKKQGFAFQKHRYYTNNVIYLRWAQAWMFRALCLYLKEQNEDMV